MNEHTIEIRVRYAETDKMGFVYYSNHLVWFEVARVEFFRAKGLCYSDIENEQHIYLPVAEAHCRYRFPIKYDDLVHVTAKLTDIGSSRLSFEYEVLKGKETAATGYTKHAFIDKSGRPIPIPSNIKDILVKNTV